MNPLVAEFLGSFLRWALAGAAGVLVHQGVITPEQSGRMLAGLTVGIITLAWSLYQKYGAAVLRSTGLAMPAGSSLEEAKANIADGIKASALTSAVASPVLVVAPPSGSSHKLGAIILIGAIGLGAGVVSSCGGSNTVPNLPALSATTDKDLRAAEMKVYGVLQAAGVLLNDASTLEASLASQGVIPPAQDAQLKATMAATAKAALAVIDDIQQGRLTTSAALQQRVNPVLQDLNNLQALVQPTGHPKLTAIVEAVAGIGVALLQGAGGAGFMR